MGKVLRRVTPLRRLAVGVVVISATVGAVPGAARAQSPNDDLAQKQRQQQQVRQEKAQAASRLDVLQANDEQVKAALQALRDDLSDQGRALVAAQQRADAAQQAVDDARAVETAKTGEVGKAQSAVRTLALRAYVGGDAGASLDNIVSASSGSEAVVRSVLGSLRSAQMVDALDSLERAQQDLQAARQAASRAAERADTRAKDAAARLSALEESQARQVALSSKVESKLEAALAEMAALSRLDSNLANQIAAQQAEIAAQLKKAREEAAAAAAASAARSAASPGAASPGTARPSQPLPASPGDTPAPPRQPASGGSSQPTPAAITPSGEGRGANGTFQLVKVGGIEVAASLGDDLARLLPAAQAAGFRLAGGGYRSPDEQIAMRASNCGTSDYAIWQMPPSECSPPTARPGASMHELGLAIDFVCNGSLIDSRFDSCYRWLAANASRYGLYNLPGEPWHWSTNGN